MTETLDGAAWLPMHIFYASNPNPLLTECLAPLTKDLRERRLIQRYFFIRYWQEGTHVRLRMLPSTPAVATEVRAVAESAVDAFFGRRPALFRLDAGEMAAYHKDMFITEYGERQWEEQYGETGMPIRENNSYAYIPYQPEYDRYGGPDGVRLAEWHFERSSDLVLELLAAANVHVRSVMFGLSAQIGLILCHAFRPTPPALVRFLHYYQEYWTATYPNPLGDQTSNWEKAYDKTAATLVPRVAEILDALQPGRRNQMATFLQDWADHGVELRERVTELSHEGRLVFQSRGNSEVREPITEPDLAMGILLSGYLHMTNNRLGVSVHEEAYLAHLLGRAVREVTGTGPVS
ncbi:lantibiotic dehydratase C-terminal domain-containing protein [Nonomuraea sp. NPDC050404]|uniref:lantibiotic dehydratase C-terminal domain-containing protein n=1 Tax=Nonomuraea sp. NPDC050404 TaxID=3155783 RepID=UPI0033DF4F42